jgi:hypothetical protein
MRFALILAFVSSVFFHPDFAEARPGADSGADASVQARKPTKVQKRRAARSAAKAKAKPTRKGVKATRKARGKPDKVADRVEVEDESPASAPKVEARPPVKHAPVAQTTDDEVPANEPKPRNKR